MRDDEFLPLPWWRRPVIWIVLLWLIFSVPFVVFQAWAYLEEQRYEAGLEEGARLTARAVYEDLIQKAANPECNTIFVQQDDRRVDLINVQCLEFVSADGVGQSLGLEPADVGSVPGSGAPAGEAGANGQ